MSILEVQSLQKVYTTRFGGTQVQALKNVTFHVEEGGVCGHHGRVWLRQDHPFEYPGGAG